MKNGVIRTIINNEFLVNYGTISDYFEENNLDYDGESKIDGGFTLNFCPADAQKIFKKNLKTQPEDWYYRTHPVKYTLNSSGYRTREFDDIDWKESIVIFGCSYIFGIGVTDEHTIPYFLEQLSGRPVINMGIAGSSIQTSLHNSIILADFEYPTPKAVVYIWTSLDRYQIYENETTENEGPWTIDYGEVKFNSKINKIQFNLMNIKMIRNLWKNKTTYYEGSIFNQHNLINKLDSRISCHNLVQGRPACFASARDLGHYGQTPNYNIAKQIYEKIKPQLDN